MNNQEIAQKNNKEIFRQLNDYCSAYIEKIFLLAASVGSSELDEILRDDLEDKQLSKLFPNLDIEEFGTAIEDRECLGSHLLYAGYYGWFAEIQVPTRDNFTFKNEDKTDYSSCSVYPGCRHIEYIYFDDIRELVNELKKVDHKCLQRDIKDFEKRQEKPEKDGDN